jgi:N-acetylglucosamine-6-phosphate deacetylase
MMAPGLTLRQEFAVFAKAGLSLLTILQMTTMNPAQYLGREDTMGTVEAGRTPTSWYWMPTRSTTSKTCTRSMPWSARARTTRRGNWQH